MQHAPVRTIHQSSPLDSLVRRASSRRANLPPLTTSPATPPRVGDFRTPGQAEYSPILHTRFRTSTTTFNSYPDHDHSGSDARSTYSWAMREGAAWEEHHAGGQGAQHQQRTLGPADAYAAQGRGKSMADSVYSQASYDLDDIAAHYRESWRSSDTVNPGEPSKRPTPEVVPSVVVSLEPMDTAPEPMPMAGRAPSRVQTGGNVNFSQPNLPALMDSASEGRKREVLRRNQRPSASPSPGPASHHAARSPLGQSEQHSSHPSTGMSNDSHTVSRQPSSKAVSPQMSQSHVDDVRVPSPAQLRQRQSGQRTSSLSSPPLRPPPSQSPVSLYSSYSYYQLDSASPSPTTPDNPASNATASPANLSPEYVPSRRPPSVPSPTPAAIPSGPRTPQDYLQLGIQHHEANRLAESAACFEKSATLQGGCGVGMLMWGLAQRHGWGCAKSEQAGFRWLRRAAEVAVEDLERARRGMDAGAVKSELVLAIYEVGQSFFRGWGVDKDKKMAVSYFRVAARLGDPDAQQELAFCLANGKGCKKDKKEAARWYRAAVAQGVSDVGLAWIYKEKYR